MIGNPGEPGGVGQEPHRLAPEHRNSPGIPRPGSHLCIRDPRSVRCEHGPYLRPAEVVSCTDSPFGSSLTKI